MRQPRVPEYRENESVGKYLRTLVLFLKDFCGEAWTASNLAKKGLDGISYPVTSVFNRTGDVALQLSDLNQVQAGTWDGNTAPKDIPDGITYVSGGAADSTGFPLSWSLCLSVKISVYRAMQIQVEKTSGRLYIRSATDGTTWGSWTRYLAALEVYPVGAIYLSTASTSPASLFGGTWEQIKDRFLLAAGSSYAAGGTGGAATVTLTTAQIPAHKHTANAMTGALNLRGYNDSGLASGTTATGVFSMADPWATSAYTLANSGLTTGVYHRINFSATPTINNTGGGSSHNNMPPYLTVYMWKRVS